MADHSIRIGIDSSEAERGAARVTASLRSIQQEAAKTVGNGKGIPINIDPSGVVNGGRTVTQSLRDIINKAKGILGDGLTVDINSDGMKKDAQDIARTLRDIVEQGKKTGAIPVNLDTSGMDAGAKRIIDKLREITGGAGSGKGIPVSIDPRGAEEGARTVTDAVNRVRRETDKIPGGRQGIPVSIDSSGAVSGSSQVNRSLRDIQAEAARTARATEGIGSSFNTLASSVRGLQGILATIGVGVGFKTLVDTIGAFEEKMSAVRSVTDASADDMKQLEEAARSLGATTKFSATEAAQGMEFLAQAGFSTTQIIQSMKPVLDLAAAGAIDLGRASEIASNIMGGFRLGASDMSKIADTLASAAAKGSLDINDLGMSMKYVAPVAASLGISIGDAASALVVLSNAGIKGEQGGTALRGVLASLIDPSQQAEKDIKALGITFDSLNPKTNTFTQVIDKLRAAGLDTSTAFKLFGQEGAPAILALTSNNAALAQTSQELAKVSGEARKMAEIRSDNLRGDFQNLAGAAEELTLQIGEGGLLGGMRSLTQTATGVVRVLAGMESSLGDQAGYYTTLTNVIQGLAVAVGTVYVAKALGPLIARSAEAVRSQMALVTSMGATEHATAAVAAADKAAAAANLARAQSAVAVAQAQVQTAIATDKATGSVVAQRAALAQLAAANTALIAAKVGATAAEAAHATALAATTIRARAAAAAMTLLNGAMAFLGGPIGAAITAVAAAVYFLNTRTTTATRTQAGYNTVLEKMRGINADLITSSAARRGELEAERTALLRNAEAELANLQAKRAVANQVSTVRKVLKSPIVGIRRTLGLDPDENEGDVKTFDGLVEQAQANLDRLRSEAGKPLPALTVPGSAVPPILPVVTTPDSSGGGGGGVGAPANDDSIRAMEQKKQAFDDLLVRYSDEADAMGYQSVHYGKNAQEIDRLTAQYELWNAAKVAGIQKDEAVVASIDSISQGYAENQQKLRDLQAAQTDSARVFEETRTPMEEYEAQVARLNELLRMYTETNGQVGISQETYNRALERLNATSTTTQQSFNSLNAETSRTASVFQQATQQGLNHFEDALVDIVTGTSSAKEAFASMAKAIAADLARMAIRMAIIQPLMQMFGGGGAPVFGGFTTEAAVGPISWGVAHTGGIIGADNLPTRSLPMYHSGGIVGAGAPGHRSLPPMGTWNKYHSGGLAGNEVPAILQKGEGVFTKQQMAAMAPAGGGGSSINMPITVNVSPEANTKDPAAAERQGKIISQQVQQAMDEHLRKNLRNGGLLNQSGY